MYLGGQSTPGAVPSHRARG